MSCSPRTSWMLDKLSLETETWDADNGSSDSRDDTVTGSDDPGPADQAGPALVDVAPGEGVPHPERHLQHTLQPHKAHKRWLLTCQGQRPCTARVPLMILPLLRLGSLGLGGSSSSTRDLPQISSRDLLKYSGTALVTLYFGNLESSLLFELETSSLPESQSTLSLYEQRFFPLTLFDFSFKGKKYHNFTLTLSKGSMCIFSVGHDTVCRSLVLENFPVSLCKINLFQFPIPNLRKFLPWYSKIRFWRDICRQGYNFLKSFSCKVILWKEEKLSYPKYPNQKECDRFIVHLPVFILKSSLFRKSIVDHHHLTELWPKLAAAETKSG